MASITGVSTKAVRNEVWGRVGGWGGGHVWGHPLWQGGLAAGNELGDAGSESGGRQRGGVAEARGGGSWPLGAVSATSGSGGTGGSWPQRRREPPQVEMESMQKGGPRRLQTTRK